MIAGQCSFYSSHDARIQGLHLEEPLNVRDTRYTLRRRRVGLDTRVSFIRGRLSQLIRESQEFPERVSEPASPASQAFIARFEQDQREHPTRCDATMAEKQVVCTVCLEPVELCQSYATWPCPSQSPHQFHSDCMLELLRMKHAYPLCRHPVERDSV